MIKRLIAPLALAMITLLAVAACGGSENGDSPPPPAPPPAAPTAAPGADIDIKGTRVDVNLEDPGGSGAYKFDPAKFSFSAGQEVTFVLTSESEFHTFTVEELDTDVSVDARETVGLTYTFDKAGTYKLICIPHEALGMVGEIVVQ